ncbi:MAG: hypothetical protein MJZ75_00080 [Paludibacteraceae bacterium]|nr:hypothetical protein [Paludibacteraceae bacterium]
MANLRRHIIGVVVLLGLAVHMPVMASGYNRPMPTIPEPRSAEQTFSMPMAATLVLDRIDVNCPIALTVSLNRSRRTITQWTQPTSLSGTLCFSNLLTNTIRDQIHITQGLFVNFPSEQVSFPFHVFW